MQSYKYYLNDYFLSLLYLILVQKMLVIINLSIKL